MEDSSVLSNTSTAHSSRLWAYENHNYTYDILVGFKKDDILSTIKEGLKYVSELQNILFGLDFNHEIKV